MPHIKRLSDEELQKELVERGFQAGPITDTTRAVYERKLVNLRKMLPDKERRKMKEEQKALHVIERKNDPEENDLVKECEELRRQLQIAQECRRVAEQNETIERDKLSALRMHLVGRIDGIINHQKCSSDLGEDGDKSKKFCRIV